MSNEGIRPFGPIQRQQKRTDMNGNTDYFGQRRAEWVKRSGYDPATLPPLPTPTSDDFVENVFRLYEAKRERELLDRRQPYMRNAHLLPPRDEFASLDWYVHVLKLFEQANTELGGIYRFLPTLAQRRSNGEKLMDWEASQRRTRVEPSDDEKHKRAVGLLDWRCFTGKSPLATQPKGGRDDETNKALRYLAPLVNEGSLTRDELTRAVIDASRRNGHIPNNKHPRQVESDIDRAISKFTEPFNWDRLDNDVY